MRLVWTILITTLIVWSVQIILFLLLLADWFTHIFLSLLVLFGAHLPDSAIQTFISRILTALIFPINRIVPSSSSGTSLSMVLRFGLDSLFWGIVIGSAIYFGLSLRGKNNCEKG